VSETNGQTIGPYRAGEIPPAIVVTFKDALGNALDLTGYACRWIYRQHTASGWPDFTPSDAAAVTQTATLLNQVTNKGQVQYAWVAADFVLPGNFEGEMWVGNGTNRLASVRYLWQTYTAIAVPSI
jgi:hypothetical protein